MKNLANKQQLDSAIYKYLHVIIGMCLIVGPMQSEAKQTFCIREDFASTGLINSANLGNFSSVNGAFTKVAVGPRVTGVAAPGWSADMRLQGAVAYSASFEMQTGVGSSAKNCGQFGAWFRFKSLPSSSMGIMQLVNATGEASYISVTSEGELRTQNNVTGNPAEIITSSQIISPNSWYFISVGWKTVGGFRYNLRCSVMPLGGNMTTWASGDDLLCFGNDFTAVKISGIIGGGIGFGRVGCPSLYAMDSLADIAYPDDIIPPVDIPTHWYVNPLIGDDSNDGLTPATAWKSANKLSIESQWDGLLSRNVLGPGGGDVVYIDTSEAPLVLDNRTLIIRTDGIEIRPIAGQSSINITAEKTIVPGDWSITDANNVFSTTNCEVNIVPWEDSKWLNKVYASKVDSVATLQDGTVYPTVIEALSAIPGSFYVDPTGPKLYVHPFSSSDPRTDGKIYTRSQWRDGNAAVNMDCIHYLLDGIHVQKTSVVSAAFHDSIGAYCLQHTGLSTSGTSKIVNCDLRYGSKHNFGSTDGSIKSTLIIENVISEQCSPYTDYGGATGFVSYNGGDRGAEVGQNVHIYRRCSTQRAMGRIGSTEGASGNGVTALYSHSNSESNFPFSQILVEDCNFPNDPIIVDASQVFTVKDTTGSSFSSYCQTNIFERNKITGDGIKILGAVSPQLSLDVKNCIIAPTLDLDLTPFYGFQLKGNVQIQGCTFDYRAVSGTNNNAFNAVFNRTSDLAMTLRNNFFYLRSDLTMPILGDAGSEDSVIFDYNAYSPSVGIVSRKYFDGLVTADRTFSQWQTLGFDSHSIVVMSPLVSSDYSPQRFSPLINKGDDQVLEPEDYFGVTNKIRNDIGAIEYFGVPETYSDFVKTFFIRSQQADESISGSLVDPDGDGLSNIQEYAFNLHPLGFDSIPITSSLEDGHLIISFPFSKFANDISYLVEMSDDLNEWRSGSEFTTQVSDMSIDASTQLIKVRSNLDDVSSPRCFMRLDVRLD